MPAAIEKRNKLLGDLLEGIVKEKVAFPSGLVSVLHLYYDDWDGLNNESWNVLLAFEK